MSYTTQVAPKRSRLELSSYKPKTFPKHQLLDNEVSWLYKWFRRAIYLSDFSQLVMPLAQFRG
jgi:hypothetical protein